MKKLDPVSISALVTVLTKLYDGALDRAGEQTWDTLTGLVHKLFGRRSTPAQAIERLDAHPGDPEAINALAHTLTTAAAQNPEAAQQLHVWLTTAQQTHLDQNNTTNTITGTVHGKVVQARDIHGNITF